MNAGFAEPVAQAGNEEKRAFVERTLGQKEGGDRYLPVGLSELIQGGRL
jgi:hypothetical protein